jgi:hypothetical protein
MTYEKPELSILSLAANAVRHVDQGGGDSSKSHQVDESKNTSDSDAGATSSSSAAYEADE